MFLKGKKPPTFSEVANAVLEMVEVIIFLGSLITMIGCILYLIYYFIFVNHFHVSSDFLLVRCYVGIGVVGCIIFTFILWLIMLVKFKLKNRKDDKNEN
ncbi:hypothetical protein [Liquorilactobacillus mali]|uniref:hypothetical protein n=1 Tax=Liquorilactobacillus mali TaxID=1618 RepID=UPI0002491970|nr:hypothetical protein [Liquorilactobacillus mali]